MKKVSVCFEVELPEEVSYRDAHDFLLYELGITGELSAENRLIDEDLKNLKKGYLSIR